MSCVETLKEKGYRLTPQRLMVVEILHDVDGHISGPEICRRVQAVYPHVNKSTVYCTLQLLKELDLVVEMELGAEMIYYHHAEDGHHHHLICEECGRVLEIEEAALAPLKKTLRQKYSFSADLKHLALRGRCSDCNV